MPEENKPSPRFLTIDQVATALHIGHPLVRGLVGERRTAWLSVGRNVWRTGASDVEDYTSMVHRLTAERLAAGDLPD
ncbi:DNA-binding protein [Arthrobacter sp. 24S4-2]|uniref:DNA-binding protein n=1 Tax=Arthrobacter sp. 24S4-2 TaxID=2575374 RepID=UPI0010C7A075|nr:DNA-binding protein [Arthrobacter sp. 24S4-2]QCO98063.1 DNA-binding protein [Arthrobacter sp. 24S4-2]